MKSIFHRNPPLRTGRIRKSLNFQTAIPEVVWGLKTFNLFQFPNLKPNFILGSKSETLETNTHDLKRADIQSAPKPKLHPGHRL